MQPPAHSLASVVAVQPVEPVQHEEHPEYFLKDGTVYILIPERARQTLYRLYPGLLALRSSVFKSLFSLPRSENGKDAEGMCAENPIVLYGIVRREFDYLLDYLFGGYPGEEYREEFLISVLKLSTFFEITHGSEYAVTELTRLSPFDPALQLQLGRQYRVDHWVEPAFRILMSKPLSAFTSLDATRMGLQYFHILAQTKALIEDERRAIAYTEFPLVNHWTCTTPLHCAATWRDEWWNGIVRQLFHPDAPLPLREILVVLEDVEIPGVCAACQRGTVSKLKESGVFLREEDMICTAVQQIMSLQTDEPVRASMRDLYSP
ncbi:hypothetical protein HYDPIDRAFT_28830 [Hydnomerulius pinastri MD-312]|uniref:BTB domain-containing protein n=1 Tax=Hydnomerulius pinastri MD-312 TaxID=994086 RepID=A0A0C9VED1_9AGAM|nr:hypothetical protein HYDPIDRAFT_28830 [Hydnomerulius pinastri MD-312]